MSSDSVPRRYRGLQHWPIHEDVETAVGALTADNVVQIDTTYLATTLGMLIKQWRGMVLVKNTSMSQGMYGAFFLVRGNPSVAAVLAGLRNTSVDAKSPSADIGEGDQKNLIIWDSLKYFAEGQPLAEATDGDVSEMAVHWDWQKLGGTKGIPFQDEHGPTLWAWNFGESTFSAGVDLRWHIVFRGVYLND